MAKVTFTAAEVAEKTGLAHNTITTHCKRGLVPGAYMEGKRWMMTAESLKAFENIRPRSDHERIGKRLQFVLDDEPEQVQEPDQVPEDAPETFNGGFIKKIDAETTAKIMELIENGNEPVHLNEPVHVIDLTSGAPAPELEWLSNPDPAVRALIDTAWRLMASASELFVKAGFRLAQIEAEEEETEVQA